MRFLFLMLPLAAACGGDGDDDTKTDGPGDDTAAPTTDTTDTDPSGTDTGSATDVVEVTVGPDGGVVAVGDVTLEVPAGALSADTVITAVAVGAPPDAAGVASAWDFGPDGLQFAVPATLTFDGAPAPATGERLTVSWYDEGASAWVDLPTTVAGASASAPVSHFTTFSIRTVSIGEAGECDVLSAPCGGDVVGTWTIDALCYEFSETTGTKTTSGCDVSATATVDATGTVTFDAGGVYGSQLVLDITLTSTMPAGCFTGLPSMDCGMIQPDCVGTTDTGCTCTSMITEQVNDQGTYTTSGDELAFDGDPTPSTYCVAGDTLVLWEPPETPDDALATYVLSR